LKKAELSFHGFPKACRKHVERAAEAALGAGKGRKGGEISAALVSDAAIRGLNRRYRGTDKVTDVLSFRLSKEPLCGDIYISRGRSAKQAKAAGNTWHEELCYLVLHGVLHLLDYTDYQPAKKKKMFAVQDRLFKEFKNF